jgi:signal transduction histidine kinase
MPGPNPPSGFSLQNLVFRVNSWILSRIDRESKAERRRSVLIIWLLLVAIGLVDYYTGVRVSLALFYVLPVTLSVAWLGWRAGCASGFLSVLIRVTGDLAAGGYNAGALTVFWNRLIDLSMYCVLAAILHALITLQRQLEQRVKERTAALAQALQDREELQRQLFAISRRERTSIGHELHDGLGQHLTATALVAKLMSTRLEAESHPAAAEAGTLVRLLQEAISQTRLIACGLLLSTIEPGELAGELEELCDRLHREHGTSCRFLAEGTVTGLDVGQASHFFYIAQEAARNALHHARATQVDIRLRGTENAVELSVTDNGPGLPDPRPAANGMGLRIMAHRAELIGATFRLEPAPGRGLCVSCILPKRRPTEI